MHGPPHDERLALAVRVWRASQALQLEGIRSRPWQIVPTNALTGSGLDKGVAWLAGKLLAR